MIYGSTPKTSLLEFYKTSAQKTIWKMVTKDIILIIDNQADTKEAKHLPWYKMSKIDLWTSLQKKKKWAPMPTTSLYRSLICTCNINDTPVEPNWIMCIPSAYYICKSEITLEEGIANRVTIACFHHVLCYEFLDWITWKLCLSPPASCIGCIIHYERICTCHFGIPSSWVQREHSSRKSS